MDATTLEEIIYIVGQTVRFTEQAKALLPLDDKVYTIVKVDQVPERLIEPQHAEFLGQTYRQSVGHSQWVTLDNGKRYGGKLVQPTYVS